MDTLIIASKEDSPGVNFDPGSGIFEITYRSLPEDAIEFYEPILEWLEQYKKEAQPKTIFNFKLEYFNTSSAKQIYKMMNMLQELAKTKDVEIIWHYQHEDKDMCTSGERYAKLITVPFSLVAY
jgi:hypothetical protein